MLQLLLVNFFGLGCTVLSFLDNTSFIINAQHRRDASFFLCGEASKFIYQLCFRCFTSDSVPLPSAWFLLLGLQVGDGTLMAAGEFLVRLNMANKVASACKRKAEGVHSGKRSDRALVQKTAETIKAEFVQDAMAYLKHLLSEVLRQAGLSSNIIKGLAAFDPHIMVKRPTVVALRHFDILFSSFQRRSWISASVEATCRDQYVELIDYLRAKYSGGLEVTEEVKDLIDFLKNLDLLQTREHLLHLFTLCCLCATTVGPELPVVKEGRVDTFGQRGCFIDVVLPIQSYLIGVPGSVARCTSESNLANFSLLSASFGQSAFSPNYDTWETVDAFGRMKIYKSLLSSYRSAISEPSVGSAQVEASDTSSVLDDAALKKPSSSKRKRTEKRAARSRSSSVLNKSVSGSSNV